jgi:putative ABC transport system permease protein
MYILKILFRNAFRHRLRTGLTILGITIAILAFGLLRTVIDTWHLGIEASSDYRLVTRNAVSMTFPLPISCKDKIKQVEGVTQVSYGMWFGGIYIDQKNFFANFAIDPRTMAELYPEFELDPKERQDFIRDRKGFIAGRKLVKKYGWKIGDIVTLQGTIYPGTWEFVLRGIYAGRYVSTDETQFFFQWDYLNETMKKNIPARADQVGYFVIGIKNPERSAAIAAEIDGMFKNSLAETLTETEKAFTQGFLSMVQAIIGVVQLVSFIIIVIIMAVVANTMAMTTRERIGEYAIMKALGFRGRHIALLISGESLVITMIGCFFGIVLLFPVAQVFAKYLEQYFPIFHIKTETIYFDVLAALAVALAAAIVPIHSAVRIRIADGLRRIA